MNLTFVGNFLEITQTLYQNSNEGLLISFEHDITCITEESTNNQEMFESFAGLGIK